MKPYRAALVLVLVLLFGWAAVGHADGRGGHHGGFHGRHGGFHGHHRFHGGVFIGVPLVLGAPYYYTPPPAYVQPSGGYWYYCPSAQAYYPNVPSCSEAWVPVPAS